MKKYKICVYAITKNEEKFVDKWVENMSEADYITVLDTGSTDKTVEKLKALGVIVGEKVITPWRFDVARNESMKLIPEDADIAVCTDLDEVFEPGWAEILREHWTDNADKAKYLYSWSHNERGKSLIEIWYEKIHKNDGNWYWAMPVHEAITNKDTNAVINEVWLPETFHLHHYPDPTKSRGSYLGLMKMGIEENPKGFMQNYYYGRELYYYGRYEEAIKQLIHLQQLEISDNGLLYPKAAALMFLGLSYKAIKDYKNAEISFLSSAVLISDVRDPLIELTRMFYELQQWYACIDAGERTLKIKGNKGNWYEDCRNFKELPHDFLSIAYYNIGDFKKSYEHILKAIEFDPEEPRFISNKDIILKKL